MKAYELHPFEGLDSLRLVDRPAPAVGGPHDVLVRIRAVSLNYRDIAVARAAVKRNKRKSNPPRPLQLKAWPRSGSHKDPTNA